MPSATWPHEFTTSHSYLTYPVRYAVSSALRRLSADPSHTSNPSAQYPFENFSTDTASYIPPGRNTPPFQPPPLTPLTLKGYKPSTPTAAQLLSRLLAEEIRLLVPPRLQVVDDWTLVFSLAQHGASLSTLYKRADNYWGTRGGFVLVVRDGTGSVRTSPIPQAQLQQPRSLHDRYQNALMFCRFHRSSAPTSATHPTLHAATITASANVSSGAPPSSPPCPPSPSSPLFPAKTPPTPSA